MKNIIDDKPTLDLHGRLKYSTEFVEKDDLTEKDILDIGCGFGWFELCVSTNCGINSITGMEISDQDIKTAKMNVINDKVFFKTGSAIELPFEDNSFDTVVSWEVLEHIPKNTEIKMFKEINRVLRDNGKFYMSTPYSNIIAKIFDPAWYFGHRHYTRERLISFAEQSNLKLEKSLTKGGFFEIFFMLDLYIAKWIFRRKPFFEDYLYKKSDQEYEKEGYCSIFCKFNKAANI